MIKKAAILTAVAVAWGFLGTASEALATKKVYSPIVHKGELEIEARGSYDFDTRDEKDGKQEQKYAVGYGVTDFWFTEVYGEVKKTPEELEEGSEESPEKKWEFESVEWENRFQLAEQGEWWIDTGLYFAYEFAAKHKDPDKIEVKLLLEKQLGDFVHTANLIVEREIGGETADDEEKEPHEWEGSVAWSTRYRWQQWLEPGIEVWFDLGELKKIHSFNEQNDQIGPVIYGKIGDHVKYDVGYLFGISEEAPAGTLKWIVEFEWYF